MEMSAMMRAAIDGWLKITIMVVWQLYARYRMRSMIIMVPCGCVLVPFARSDLFGSVFFIFGTILIFRIDSNFLFSVFSV
jgi:hypothetical protein